MNLSIIKHVLHTHKNVNKYVYIYTYIYIHIYMCVFVCVCRNTKDYLKIIC